MRYTFVSEWCLMLPLSYILVVRGWVPDALLAAWVLAPALTWALMRRRFESGRWKPRKGTLAGEEAGPGLPRENA
jgi:Na+-driven multidrug efflux pump